MTAARERRDSGIARSVRPPVRALRVVSRRMMWEVVMPSSVGRQQLRTAGTGYIKKSKGGRTRECVAAKLHSIPPQ
jgi:hypothetical protein